MKTISRLNKKSNILSVSLFMLFSLFSSVSAETPTNSGIPAFLPNVDNVAATQPMAIDGIWVINTIGKKIKIESGRAYAIDTWLHLFTLRISPGMVVIQNINPVKVGQYSGDDLPLLGKWTANMQTNRNLAVSVAGSMGPVQYILQPIQLDNQVWYDKEMTLAGLTPAPPGTDPVPPVINPPPEDDPIVIDDKPKPILKKEIVATDHGPYACKGKSIYLSKGSCYQCPSGYSRFSPTRKMTHEKACTKRQPGKNLYARATYVNEFSLSCVGSQFKHKGRCKSCPNNYLPKKTAPEVSTGARFQTGMCILATE